MFTLTCRSGAERVTNYYSQAGPSPVRELDDDDDDHEDDDDNDDTNNDGINDDG